ncbi:hypothetical protein BDP27DRAFT_1418200 [Rhodocollybia butyracea]|uniref:DUF7330 domain-containing protein n=1 Tax=Rhodocollybia butyracea TaxID=206335 RepID=A0A9P5UAR4_9AGAR|nr:hypothetical protein BDP27DRAFT_1418200 [Rhodocollybia butyracea]
MIVTDSDTNIAVFDSPEKKSAQVPLQALPSDQDAAPPPYTSSDPSSSIQFVLPENTKPSNFASFSQKHKSVKGTYILDPSQEVPSDWLPPLPEGETEKNSHKPILRDRKKVLLSVSSKHSPVSMSIHRDGPSPPFVLKASSKHANVTVKIPRSFKGSVTAIINHGRVSMSDAVSAQASVFSDVNGVKRFFVGDLNTRNVAADDEMFLENVHGSIKISFDDEDHMPGVAVKSAKGIFSRMFG